MNSIEIQPIGVVGESGFTVDGPKVDDVSAVTARIDILDKYAGGLTGLEGEKRIDVIFWLDRVSDEERGDLMSRSTRKSCRGKGVLATRKPQRPNPFGVTRVELVNIEGNQLVVKGLDAYPGTPILDVKPARDRLRSGARTA
jgi:tRNA-Thr(GGU) m(6)t(6)A37 methyltransferase TsaA